MNTKCSEIKLKWKCESSMSKIKRFGEIFAKHWNVILNNEAVPFSSSFKVWITTNKNYGQTFCQVNYEVNVITRFNTEIDSYKIISEIFIPNYIPQNWEKNTKQTFKNGFKWKRRNKWQNVDIQKDKVSKIFIFLSEH